MKRSQAYSYFIGMIAITIIVGIVFFAIICRSNYVVIFRYLAMIILIIPLTALFHFTIGPLYHWLARTKEETIQEHFLYYIPAYVCWTIIDFIIFNSFILGYTFQRFFLIKLMLLFISMGIIFFYSWLYYYFVKIHFLIMDLSGFALSLTIIFFLDLIISIFL